MRCRASLPTLERLARACLGAQRYACPVDLSPKPLQTLGELDAIAKAHANRRLHAVNIPWLGRDPLWLLTLINGLSALLQILVGHRTIGGAIVMAGLLLLGPELYRREPEVPDLDDRPGLIQFYVDELSTSSSTSSVWLWTSLAASLLLTVGYAITMSSTWAGVLGVLWLVVFLVPRYLGRMRLAQVRALLGSLPKK